MWQAPWDASRTLQLRKPANNAVLAWAGRMFALYERDLPYELDEQLRTRGRTDAGVWGETDVMSAHYRVLMDRGSGQKRLVMFGALEAGLDIVLKVVELDEAGDKVSGGAIALVPLPHAARQEITCDNTIMPQKYLNAICSCLSSVQCAPFCVV